MPLQKYTGEVIPLQKYEGEILPLDQEIQSRGQGTPPAPPASGPILQDEQGNTAQTQAEVPSAEEQFRLEHPEVSGVVDAVTAPVKGLYNTGAETVGTGLDIADAILGTEMGSTFRKSPVGPFVHTGRKGPDFVQDAAQVAGGLYTGGRLAQKGLGKLGGAGLGARIARGAATTLASEAGGVIAMDKTSPRIFVNDSDSMIPDVLEESWTPAIDPNAPDAVVRLKAAADLYQEAVIASAGLGMAGGAIRPVLGYGTTILSNIKNAANKDKLEQGFAKDLYEIGARITPDMSQDERIQAIHDFITAMKKNEGELINLGDTDIKDISLKEDTITKIISTLDPKNPEDLARINVLEGLRSAALQGRHSPNLETTLNAPKRALDDTLESLQSTRGGDAAIETTKDEAVNKALGEVRIPRQKVTDAEAELVGARRGLDDQMKNNPAFKDVMDRTEPGVNVDMTAPVTKIANEITDKVHTAETALTKRKNELYAAIPENTPVDQTLLNDAVEKAMPALDDNLRKGLGDAGSSYKRLSEFASNDLERQRQALRAEKKWAEADMIRDLQKSINSDQLDFIAKNTDPVTAKAAQDAKKYYVEEYVPKFREGIGPEIQSNRRFKSPVDAQVENRTMIERTLSDNKKPEYSDKIIDIISTPEGGGDPKLALDYGMATIAKKFQSIINTRGKVDAETMTQLGEEVDRFQPIIAKVAPEKRKEINDFLTTIRDKNFNAKEVETKLAELQGNLKDAEDRYLGEYMEGFFKKGADGYTALPDGYKSLKKVMFDSQKADQLRRIRLSVAGNPVAEKGLEAAWGKALAEHIGKNAVTTSAIPPDLASSAKIIFDGQPELLSGIQEIIKRAQAGERANTLRQGGGFDAGAAQEARGVGINQTITWIWGVLNPTAAKIRTVSRDVLKNRDAKPVAQKAIDTILADKDAYVQIAQKALKREKGKLSLQDKRVIFRSMVKAGIYEPEDEKEIVGKGDVREQTEQAIPAPK